MGPRYYISRALALPPHIVVKKAIRKAQQVTEQQRKRRHDQHRPTYSINEPLDSVDLNSYLGAVEHQVLRPLASRTGELPVLFLDHRFDLLGSGWVVVEYDMRGRGIGGFTYNTGMRVKADSSGVWLASRVNESNVKESQRIWRLIDTGYTPIDWHLDFKSGYRWPENTWYHDTQYAHEPGVDIKVPWELARMQHLPQLALAYAIAEDQGDHERSGNANGYAREFRNQVLDFIATNPPRFGANWRCTMDVGIRVANWLFAHDLFKTCGAQFDNGFRIVFKRSVYEHGLYIINNLEWSKELTSNHYLSDIVGLLFVAAYLPGTPETDVWLAFAVQELVKEVGVQFGPDGANFEASTSYHRLSAELIIYATALVLGLSDDKLQALERYDHRLHKVEPPLKPAPVALYPLPGSDRRTPFPAWYIERLEKMAEFTMHITKPDGRIPQIGDNDSGRFLKIMPSYRQMSVKEAKQQYKNLVDYDELADDDIYWVEDHLDHRHLVAAINGLFDREDFAAFAAGCSLETHVIKHLAGGVQLPTRMQGASELPQGKMAFHSYPDFGLFVYRSDHLYLAVRCGHNGQNGNGGHAHNDQLSFELSLDGVPFIVDPGTYLYTPIPEQRNLFRSTASHNTLALANKEQNGWLEGPIGLFRMDSRANAKAIQADEHTFVGEHYGFGPVHRRTIEIQETRVKGLDECTAGGKAGLFFHLAPDVDAGYAEVDNAVILSAADMQVVLKGGPGEWVIADGVYSPAYGILQQNRVVHLRTGADRIEWEIEMAGYYEN